MRRFTAVIFGAALLVASSLAAADDAPPAADAALTGELAEPVPDMPDRNWHDLLVQIFPDIAPAHADGAIASASEMNDIRSIGAGDDSWMGCGEHTNFTGFDAKMLRFGDQRRWLVTVQLASECVGLLALYDADGKLVDAVNVKGDQHVSFTDDFLRPLGAAGALITVWNWHDNSNQSYDDVGLILAKPDGFSAIGDFPAFGSRMCRSQFTEDPVVTVTKMAPMARIDMKVKRRTKKLAADCETQIGRETLVSFDGHWRWSAAKGAYVPHTKELDLLFDWNKKHF